MKSDIRTKMARWIGLNDPSKIVRMLQVCAGAILLVALSAGLIDAPAFAQRCNPGYGICPGGGCVPLGSVCCGGGRYCKAGQICINNGAGCLNRSSDRVCANGSYCDPGSHCATDGRCYSNTRAPQNDRGKRNGGSGGGGSGCVNGKWQPPDCGGRWYACGTIC